MKRSHDERGSAINEFVLIALPLFLPLLILFTALNKSSSAQINQEMMVRQLLYAFTSGVNDENAYQRADFLLSKHLEVRRHGGRQVEGRGNQTPLRYSVRCQTNPCITPGSAVEVTLYGTLNISGIPGREKMEILARAKGFVDKWG